MTRDTDAFLPAALTHLQDAGWTLKTWSHDTRFTAEADETDGHSVTSEATHGEGDDEEESRGKPIPSVTVLKRHGCCVGGATTHTFNVDDLSLSDQSVDRNLLWSLVRSVHVSSVDVHVSNVDLHALSVALLFQNNDRNSFSR